jgi:hypothetical protein
MEVVEPTSSLPKSKFTLEIHKVIQTLQNENGLKHHDHMRYCSYLTKRLRKVRKAIDLPCSKGKEFENKEITPDIIKNELFLLVPLLAAERAWSTAAVKKDAFANVGKQKLRRTELKRHSKAAKWAQALETLCVAVGDSRTVLEATAYSNWIIGQDLLEHEIWAEALSSLMRAKSIYVELSSIGTLEQRDLFSSRAAHVDPSIRFCRYNLYGAAGMMDDQSGPQSTDEDSLLSLFASDPDLLDKLEGMRAKRAVERSRSAEGDDMYGAFGNLVWCGSRVTVPAKIDGVTGGDTTPIHTACTKAKSALDMFKRKLTETGIAADSEDASQTTTHCFTAIDDARALVGKHLGILPATGGAEVNDLRSRLTHLQNYLHYTKLDCQCRRGLQLGASMDDASLCAEKARVYEQLSETVTQMTTIITGWSFHTEQQ